ncbi:MerR family transcriptional regulator [Chitinispirillales bacterium ANBcel5]|uniref:MerR family transcriptional regulator n=1 Tax=Cellulosispirillum alkaliphilum TaxID=3039283 RepID=UPI002A56F201|nr:MerR family transcriptional regulator [Chitinispirillales bacterium ANBcel5]
MDSDLTCEQMSLLPQKKIYYSISDVSRLTGLEPHVLRYWEHEFGQLNPKKNRAGNRAYKEKDIETVKYIKRLLYEDKFTIEGAKKQLSLTHPHSRDKAEANLEGATGHDAKAPLEEIKSELSHLLRLLKT